MSSEGKTNIELSVVIPAYNESERLPETLGKILEFLDGRSGDSEIVVSDDGSVDDTSSVTERILGAQSRHAWQLVRHPENRGKGHATRLGMLEVSAE